MIKTFRGLIASGAQDTIVLHTNDGSTGYRIVKFQLMPNKIGAQYSESQMKIYKVAQTTVNSTVDFSDNTLLGAAYIENEASGNYVGVPLSVIFDKELFNQDIYVTHEDVRGDNRPCNYYIELEQVKLDLSESTVATLKDIRNVTDPVTTV